MHTHRSFPTFDIMASTEQQPQPQQQQQPQQPQQQQQQPQQQTQQQDIDLPVTAAHASQGGTEVNKKVLYVGVDQNVTEEMLLELFKVTGNVTSIKIFPDKNRRGLNYAFVEYDDNAAAELAFSTLDHRVLNQSEITINWAVAPCSMMRPWFITATASLMCSMTDRSWLMNR